MIFKKMLFLIVKITANFLAFFYLCFIIIVNKTLKVEIINADYAKGQVVFALWHQLTFVPFFVYRKKEIAMLVMDSFRGMILGFCARRLGFLTIALPENNLSQKNARNLVNFLKLLKRGKSGMIAVDGPSGPKYEIKQGIFSLAKSSNLPIVACNVELDKFYLIKKRWDHYLIPKPFSKVKIIFEKPYYPTLDNNLETKKLLNLLQKKY